MMMAPELPSPQSLEVMQMAPLLSPIMPRFAPQPGMREIAPGPAPDGSKLRNVYRLKHPGRHISSGTPLTGIPVGRKHIFLELDRYQFERFKPVIHSPVVQRVQVAFPIFGGITPTKQLHRE